MGKIRAMFVFEIMGRPPEHIKITLNQFIDKLDENPALKVEKRTVHDPKLIEKENVKDFYTTFAEVELTADDLNVIFDVVLHMLPSHVEILEPIELRMQNFELSSTLSTLAIKIHKYDEIAKSALIERNILTKRLEEMQAKINELEGGKKSKGKASSESKAEISSKQGSESPSEKLKIVKKKAVKKPAKKSKKKEKKK